MIVMIGYERICVNLKNHNNLRSINESNNTTIAVKRHHPGAGFQKLYAAGLCGCFTGER